MAPQFTPPDMILVFIGFEILLHYLFPVKQIVTSPLNYLGILLIILGAIPNFWIYFYFKNKDTTTKIYETPKVLVTSGLFRISRNPNYFGMVIVLLGIALLLGSLITLVFPILFLVLTDIFVIRKEEKNLEKKFGKRYLQYKNKVRRWI
jgi:protein-S-isoprenylcysteine O-methyltransferase Ste14